VRTTNKRASIIQAALDGVVEELKRGDDPVLQSVKEHLEYLLGLAKGEHRNAKQIKTPEGYAYSIRDLDDSNRELATLVARAWDQADAMWFEHYPSWKPSEGRGRWLARAFSDAADGRILDACGVAVEWLEVQLSRPLR
jgi:hypothetical protein